MKQAVIRLLVQEHMDRSVKSCWVNGHGSANDTQVDSQPVDQLDNTNT